MTKWLAVLISLTSLGLSEQQRQTDESRPVTVDCNAGGAINRVLKSLKPGDVVLGQDGLGHGLVYSTQPNTTTVPNGLFGIRCESGAYLDGPIGSLVGKSGAKDVSDTTCIDRSTR
jgi:hypothetical protein